MRNKMRIKKETPCKGVSLWEKIIRYFQSKYDLVMLMWLMAGDHDLISLCQGRLPALLLLFVWLRRRQNGYRLEYWRSKV